MVPSDQKAILAAASLGRGLENRTTTGDSHSSAAASASSWFRTLKRAQQSVDRVYLPGGEWAVYLSSRTQQYHELHEGGPAAEQLLSNFWRNELGPIVSQYSYFEDLAGGHAGKVHRFVDRMTYDHVIWRSLAIGPVDELELPVAGNPWGLSIDNTLVSPQSHRFHAQSRRILDITSDADHPVILELGGGFGGMAAMLLRLAHRSITYVNADLPETAAIAAYYLLATQPNVKVKLHEPGDSTYRVQDYDIVLMMNSELSTLNTRPDLFLNAFSLSEMPVDVIGHYLAAVQELRPRYILHNNVDRRGVVNRGFHRTPGSEFPISPQLYKLIGKTFDLFQGHTGDYREFLYERRSDAD